MLLRHTSILISVAEVIEHLIRATSNKSDLLNLIEAMIGGVDLPLNTSIHLYIVTGSHKEQP